MTAAFPTGVALVAAKAGGRPAGILVNSFTSVSLDPPLVSVNISRSSPTLIVIEGASEWGISILADDQHVQFAALTRQAAERFDGLELTTSKGGAMLLPGAAASLLVQLESKFEAGDHFILLLRVRSLIRRAAAPAIFHDKALHSLPQSTL